MKYNYTLPATIFILLLSLSLQSETVLAAPQKVRSSASSQKITTAQKRLEIRKSKLQSSSSSATSVSSSIASSVATKEDVEVLNNGEMYYISTLRTDGAAFTAGLRPGDIITAVDNVDVKRLRDVDISQKLSNILPGQKILVTVSGKGAITVVGIEEKNSITTDIIIGYQEDVCIVRVMDFGNLFAPSAATNILSAAKKCPRGMILDLRQNPGGDKEAIQDFLSLFLIENSDVAQLMSTSGITSITTKKTSHVPTALKIAVLYSQGSAIGPSIVVRGIQMFRGGGGILVSDYGMLGVKGKRPFTPESSIAQYIVRSGGYGAARILNGGGEADAAATLRANSTSTKDDAVEKAIDAFNH